MEAASVEVVFKANLDNLRKSIAQAEKQLQDFNKRAAALANIGARGGSSLLPGGRNVVSEALGSKEAASLTTYTRALEQTNKQTTVFVSNLTKASTIAPKAAAANNQLATSTQRAANSMKDSAFQTGNIAAQFQDIAVTAQMGMNPMIIALQQGTQLSAVLNTMQNPVKGLGAAFMSVLNPVSLLTIGFVGLAAAGAQWIGQAFAGAEDAESALERHNKWLEKILEGYNEIREAAKFAAEEAGKLPQEALVSNLQAQSASDAATYAEALERVSRAQEELNQKSAVWAQYQEDSARMFPGDDARLQRFQSLIDMAEKLNSLSVDTNSTKEEVDAFINSVTSLMNEAKDPALREMAAALVAMGEELLDLREIATSTKTALDYSSLGLQSFDQIRSGVQDLVNEHRRLEAEARAAAAALQASYQAAIQAAAGYGQAAGAANVFAGSLQRLQALIPAVAAAQAAQQQLTQAQIAYADGRDALEKRRSEGMNRDTYAQQMELLTSTYKQATEAVSGFSAMEQQLATQTKQNSIEALQGREQGLARVRQQYADQEQQIKALINTGATQAQVDELLAENSKNLAAALANTNAQFDRTEVKASGASKAVKAAEKEFNSFISTADALAEALFPGEYAMREARQLQAALDMYGNSLDEFQRKAVEAEIGDLIRASALGLRNLEDKAKDTAYNMAEEFKNTLGSVLSDLFSGPIEDFDDFLNKVMSGLGQLGQSNLQASFDSLFGGGETAVDPTTKIANAVQKGAQKGTETGTSTGLGDFFGGLFGGGEGGQSGIASVLSAGAGGLGIGYQTQDPIMGALGGALSGISAGPIGIAVGALGGLVGGLFGMNKALKEAQEKLAKVRGEIDSFIDVGEGRGLGEMTQAFRDYWDKSHEYQELAMKAGDGALQKRLQDATNSFFLFLDKDFRLGFEGTIESLSSGQGLSGAFVSAQQQIVGLREELKGFIGDTEFLGKKLGELGNVNNADEVAEQIRRAQKAAQEFALSVLYGAEELTEFETSVLGAEGKASALQVTLEQLGMSAEDAAKAIDGALNMALAKLRDEYISDLNNSINELSGFGFLNEILEAQVKYQERLRDASALGLDGAGALQELNLSLANIAKSAGLTQAQINALAKTFPAMAGIVELLGSEDTQRNLINAQAQLRSAYDTQARSLETTIGNLNRFITSLQKFRENLRLDALSPLSPLQRLQEAQQQFRQVMAAALTGDEEALGRVEDVSRQYLEEARSYYGTSTNYFAIFEEVEALLSNVENAAKNQLTEAQKELSLLQEQVGKLIDIDNSVMSVADAIAALQAAQAASDAALAAQLAALAMNNQNAIAQVYQQVLGREADAAGLSYWQGQMNQGKSLGQITGEITNSREGQIRSLYQSILGRNADDSGLQYWMASGKSIEQIMEDMLHLKSIGQFATGGFHNGGLRIVGENGPELEMTGPSRIWSAQQTSNFMSAANSNSSAETLRELQALRQEVSQLRAGQNQGNQIAASGFSATVSTMQENTQIAKQQATANWQNNYKRFA